MEPDFVWRKELGHVMGMDTKMNGYFEENDARNLSTFQIMVKKFNEEREKYEAEKKEDARVACVRKAVQERVKASHEQATAKKPMVGCIDRPITEAAKPDVEPARHRLSQYAAGQNVYPKVIENSATTTSSIPSSAVTEPDIVLSPSEIRESILAEEIAALSNRINYLLGLVRK